MKEIASKNVYEKTSIIMMVADEDRNGILDRFEVKDLCKICMD